MPTASSLADQSPHRRESEVFLELAGHVLDRFRPNVLLIYGGHPVSLELMRRARQRGIAIVPHLCRSFWPEDFSLAHDYRPCSAVRSFVPGLHATAASKYRLIRFFC